MHLKTAAGLLAVCVMVGSLKAQPELSYSGYLDADVWSDLAGNFYSNSELDLGLTFQFSDKVSANLYITMLSGGIPAGYGANSDRWASADFDGFDVTYESAYGTFSVGDLVYQFGGFNYYFYKRLSMITPESFTRGIQYSNTFGPVTQTFLVGAADLDANTGDILGTSEVALGEEQAVTAVYGVRGSALEDFGSGFDIQAGLQYTGSFGEMLSMKADVGYLGIAGEERSNVITLLAEPSVSMGQFSVAGSFYYMMDSDSINDQIALASALVGEDPEYLFGLGDEMFAYVEPGYSFNDVIAAGLPLEYHAGLLDDEDDNSFWVVPTLYVYPTDGVEWWIWGQVVVPQGEGDNAYGLGSEIIVNF